MRDLSQQHHGLVTQNEAIGFLLRWKDPWSPGDPVPKAPPVWNFLPNHRSDGVGNLDQLAGHAGEHLLAMERILAAPRVKGLEDVRSVQRADGLLLRFRVAQLVPERGRVSLRAHSTFERRPENQ